MATKYNLTDVQIRHLAIICYREQGSNDAGVRACASHMCNYYEKWQKKNYPSVYECTFGSGWYWSRARNEAWIAANPKVPAGVIAAVRDVIVNGHRNIPEYVDEYDCLSDIAMIINDGKSYTREKDKDYILNRANYIPNKTIIQSIYAEGSGDRYTFCCFPDGVDGKCDAFGYINKNLPEKEGKTAMTIPDSACTIAENIAADQRHGYSQANRWGPDYDCSSLVINAYIKAGVPIDKTKVYYTGNMQGLKDYGFVDVTGKVDLNTGNGMLRGDILYYHISGTNGHTAMFCGNGKIVHARGQSYGSSATGDQGSEIAVTAYSRSKWQHVLRYKGSVTDTVTDAGTVTHSVTSAQMPEVEEGSIGAAVSILQAMLDLMGYIGANYQPLDIDGEFGPNTAYALIQYQTAAGLMADGVCGTKTWTRLREGMKV